jgi:hypothetical protein
MSVRFGYKASAEQFGPSEPAKPAGRVADGFICTSGKPPELYEQLLAKVQEGAEAAGRDAGGIERMIEIKVSYDRDFGHLVFHGPGGDQRRFLEQFSADVLPLLRKKWN